MTAQDEKAAIGPADTCPRCGQKVDSTDGTYAVEQHEIETTAVEQLELQSTPSVTTIVDGIGRYFHPDCLPFRGWGQRQRPEQSSAT